MKKKITFIAFDEKEFDTENECVEYENKIQNILKYTKVYDEYTTELECKNLEELIQIIMEDAYYLAISDNEVALILYEEIIKNNRINSDVYSIIKNKGLYYYDETKEKWMDYKDFIIQEKKDAESVIKYYEKRINDLKNNYNKLCLGERI